MPDLREYRTCGANQTMMDDMHPRQVSVSFTKEMAEAHGYSFGAFKELLEEKAEMLEASISGVVIVSGGDYNAVDVRCYYPRTAEEDIIRHAMESLQAEVMREMSEKETYWGQE